jgi:enamine deaminase RidA (YjgF/YER057c/UK114 family)
VTGATVHCVLEAGGATWEDTVMVRVHLTGTDHFAESTGIRNDYVAGLWQAPAARTTACPRASAGPPAGIGAPAVLG